MTVLLALVCEGDLKRCGQRFELTGCPQVELRKAARANGWSCRRGSRDLCPDCADREASGVLPAGACVRCVQRERPEFSDALGHDFLGHRTANRLASQGVTSWEQLINIAPSRLRGIKNLGAGGIELVQNIQRAHHQGVAP